MKLGLMLNTPQLAQRLVAREGQPPRRPEGGVGGGQRAARGGHGQRVVDRRRGDLSRRGAGHGADHRQHVGEQDVALAAASARRRSSTGVGVLVHATTLTTRRSAGDGLLDLSGAGPSLRPW